MGFSVMLGGAKNWCLPNTGALSVVIIICESGQLATRYNTVEPRYNEVLGTIKITLLYQVSHYIRVKKQRNINSWDEQNYLVIRGFCYIRPLYNEVPLYCNLKTNVKWHRWHTCSSCHFVFNSSACKVYLQKNNNLYRSSPQSRNLYGTILHVKIN